MPASTVKILQIVAAFLLLIGIFRLVTLLDIFTAAVLVLVGGLVLVSLATFFPNSPGRHSRR